MSVCPAEAPADCTLCPRLVSFRVSNRSAEPSWHNGPVPSFGREDAAQVRLLIVGLAPGLRGANRTGRPFTGDYAGDLLYQTLKDFGFAAGDYQARFYSHPVDGVYDLLQTSYFAVQPPDPVEIDAPNVTVDHFVPGAEIRATIEGGAVSITAGKDAQIKVNGQTK